LDRLTQESIGLVLSTIEGNTLTQTLLEQAQSQAEELRSQQEELRESNEDLERQGRILAERNLEAEQRTTEIEISKRLIEEKAGQLALSSKYKSEFIANMSHELRTPLNSLLILAEQLAGNPDDTMTERQVEYASVILASGRDLLFLLNSILDLAKAESGAVAVELSQVSIPVLCSALVREFEPVARSQGLKFSVDVAPDVPAEIVTDPQRLRQVLKNLLANAFKFTEQGAIRVRVYMAEHGWNPGTEPLSQAASVVAFSVSDSGIGVKGEDQQRVFEAFVQADGTTTRSHGGSGLGLSISRELVGVLGGEITLTSAPGQGSTFTVYLPDRRAPVLSLAQASAPGERSGSHGLQVNRLAGIKILVVDDDARNTFALGILLEQEHAEVTIAASGVAALATLERSPEIDVVLMDIMMPVMDGYAAIRAIRKIDRFSTLPIVVVTAKVVPGERQRCMNAGASDYLPKPVDRAELFEALRRWLPSTAPLTPTGPLNGSALPPPPPLKAIATAANGIFAEPDTTFDRPMAVHDGPESNGTQDHVVDRRRILVVDDDYRNSFALSALLERGHADVTVAASAHEAFAVLQQNPDIDFVLMDIIMPEMDGYDAIRKIRTIEKYKTIPIIALTGKVTIGERQRCIDAGANDYLPKPVDSADLLAALKLWLPVAPLPPALRRTTDAVHPTTSNGDHADTLPPNGLQVSIISGVNILIVDDDYRNIFALSALLERGHAVVTVAEGGPEALATLQRDPDVDIVLMDIMMPVMDGYETIRAIRALGQFKTLPIVAVTGKVVPGERQRCIDAGANDYVPKPVDTSELLAALRPWIPKTSQSEGPS
jgi:CheY-like chemotaxis protein/signal transduction histidine kinase